MSLEKKHLTDDKTCCKSIAKSISDIIRFSLDEEFRKNCFELFQVSSTQETEREIKKRLIHLIQNENTDLRSGEFTSQNISENTSRINDKENSDAQCADQNNKNTIPTPSGCSDKNIHAAPQNIFKRNWLEISSQKYKEIIKRKKLNYYSQPQFGDTHQNDFEFFSYSNSQSSSCPPLSLEEKILPEPSGDTINFCKDKFRDSLKDNAQKYFKKNLRSHKYILKPNRKY